MVEIARRALAQQLRAAPVFDAPQQVKDYVALQLAARTQEVFAVLFLDGQHRLLRLEETVPRHADADQRLPARGRASARCSSTPARWSWRTTIRRGVGRAVARRRVPDAVAEERAALVDVRVLDHLVVGQGQVVSFAERGLL